MVRPLSMLFPVMVVVAARASAQDAENKTGIYNDSKKYGYFGCFNETTGIKDSSGNRALPDGINEVKQGEMTVPMCLSFCGEGKTEYRYAGLEWSRECWCSQSISGIAEKLDDSACTFPCEGDNTTTCGGALKLTVYRVSSAAAGLVPSGLLGVVGVAAALASLS